MTPHNWIESEIAPDDPHILVECERCGAFYVKSAEHRSSQSSYIEIYGINDDCDLQFIFQVTRE